MTSIESKLRLGSGLVLTVYVVQHFINHAFGIVSFAAAEAFRESIAEIFQTIPGQIALYGALLIHVFTALKSVYLRASLRMPFWQWMQLICGLAIAPLLVSHIIATRGMHVVADFHPDYYYVVTGLLLEPQYIFQLGVLAIILWGHMAVGLHFWLRLKPGYRHYLPYLYAATLLIPALAVAGVTNMMQEATSWVADQSRLASLFANIFALPPDTLTFMRELDGNSMLAQGCLLVLILLLREFRLWRLRRKGTYLISHNNGRRVRGRIGQTVLEALREARVPHASVCGGHGRCTTCRVRIADGLSALPLPEGLEATALKRIASNEEVRLACQMRPQADVSITALVLAQQSLAETLHVGGVQGHEEKVVAMFVDMRGSTSMGERILAYDVVFILNRFFTELSLALEETHGHYAQFAGDGLMALYGIDAARKNSACSDALLGAQAMFDRLARLNEQLATEFGEQIQMGVGIHGGSAIVGTMGPPKTPLLTAVGDNINIAARLEAQTKNLGCDLIISTETMAAEEISYQTETVQTLAVRGRNESVAICTMTQNELRVLLNQAADKKP